MDQQDAVQLLIMMPLRQGAQALVSAFTSTHIPITRGFMRRRDFVRLASAATAAFCLSWRVNHSVGQVLRDFS